MEALEFGYELMRRRPKLQALARWVIADRRRAAAAVEKTLAAAWLKRETVRSEAELEPRLRHWFRAALAEVHGAGAGADAPCGCWTAARGGEAPTRERLRHGVTDSPDAGVGSS